MKKPTNWNEADLDCARCGEPWNDCDCDRSRFSVWFFLFWSAIGGVLLLAWVVFK